VRDGTEINAVLTHKDTADISEGWNFPANREDILKAVNGWDPVFVRVWEKIENIIDWKLVYRPCLEKWVSDSGLIAIMGGSSFSDLRNSIDLDLQQTLHTHFCQRRPKVPAKLWRMAQQ
jgi:salicylate hydroxylase